MKKIGLSTVISIGLNFFLMFWLINQYQNDAYFQSYVNTTIGQIYPFIVLTIGVGGGSGLGYLLLKRKHGDRDIASRIQTARSFKPVSSIASPSSSQSKNLPTGMPPTPASKHTAYAVPSLPKNLTPGGSKSAPATSWSTGAKAPSFGSFSQKQDSSSKTTSTNPPTLQTSVPRPETPQASTFPRAQSDISARPGQPTPWRPDPAIFGERKPDSGPIFQKPGMDLASRQDSPALGKPGTQPSGSPQSNPLPGTKWQPPDQKRVPGQWTDNPPRSAVPPVPPKWGPPGGSPPQGQSTPPQGVTPRPSSLPPRPPFPQSQGGPRPFVFQGPGRPGEPGPMGVPRPFRPDQNRPPQGMGPQQRPPQPVARPTAPQAGPMPQPWTPPSQTSEKKETSNQGSQERSSLSSETDPSKPSLELKGSETAGGGGEMDWDTALDTILKTLRKDRVGDKQ